MTSTTFFIIFIPILAILLLAINLLLAPHNPYQEKDSVFECGFHSFLGQNRTQFSISFFIFGLLFLLFDLEILLVYPYSVSSYTNDLYGLVIMMVFFVLLTLGFIFELGKNALTIDSRQTFFNNGDLTIVHGFISAFFTPRTFSEGIGLIITENTKMSGFYTGKGKGKAIVDPDEPEKDKVEPESTSETDEEEALEIKKAIALSMRKRKKGSPSNSKPDSPEKDNFETISDDTRTWKFCKDKFKAKAEEHNILREKVNNQITPNKLDTDKLAQYIKDLEELKGRQKVIEKRLSMYGINPEEQFGYESDSDSDGDYSSDNSNKSEDRPTKRVRYSNPKDNIDMTIAFPIFNIGVLFSFVLRCLSIMISAMIFLLVHLEILPDLIIPLVGIHIVDLLSLYLMVNFIKLIYKTYNIVVALYKSYLKKDYLVLYINFFFSIVIILWYFI